jgi:hypothetical protein
VVGRLARPNLRPARTVSSTSAKGEGPARRLAARRIAPAILLSEELPDISARWREIARGLQGQQACETARGTVENDGWHRSWPALSQGVASTPSGSSRTGKSLGNARGADYRGSRWVFMSSQGCQAPSIIRFQKCSQQLNTNAQYYSVLTKKPRSARVTLVPGLMTTTECLGGSRHLSEVWLRLQVGCGSRLPCG